MIASDSLHNIALNTYNAQHSKHDWDGILHSFATDATIAVVAAAVAVATAISVLQMQNEMRNTRLSCV